MEQVRLLKGDNRELLKTLEDNSVDSVITDPPYALTSIKNRFGKPGSAEAQYGTDGAFQRASKGFMGKEWDSEVPSVEVWKEVLRVLKPGGHVLSFGGTRTYHHMVMNIELAGFEIRDSISYMYGSGFPKSHNIGKAVDKLSGNEREVVGEKTQPRMNNDFGKGNHNQREIRELEITKGNSEWEGWGTALKPSMELICLARKPLTEKSIAENVLKHGTGGINIDDCRVESNEKLARPINEANNNVYGNYNSFGNEIEPEGRFPANTILECICDEVIPGEKGEIKKTKRERKYEAGDGKFGITNDKSVEGIDNYNDKGDIHTNPECPCYILDKQSGVKQSTRRRAEIMPLPKTPFNGEKTDKGTDRGFDDKGGASRFFYTAKVSKKERNMGLDDFDKKSSAWMSPDSRTDKDNYERTSPGMERFKPQPRANNHPTVKPINLMTYLCRLITPKGGVILDMYMGSGSTGISALLEGFKFVGMEMDEDYFNIAEARINNYEQYRQFKK